MKRHLLLFALVLSGLFNVFFVAGYLKARAEAAPDVAAVVGRELGLDTQQEALFQNLRESGRADAELYESGITLVRRELVDQLNQPDRDPDRIVEIVEREADLRRQWRLAEAGRFADFVESLQPQQRHELQTRMRRAAAKKERHEAFLRRFDADGDGVLNDAERQAAREHMQQRWAEGEKHWRDRFGGAGGADRRGPRRAGMERRIRVELITRFDADGDGRLDEQEQAALFAWLDEAPPR